MLTTFVKIGYSLNHIALCVQATALLESCNTVLEQVNNFLTLYQSSWQIYSNNARATQNAKTAYKPEPLPSTSDVRKFKEYVVKMID